VHAYVVIHNSDPRFEVAGVRILAVGSIVALTSPELPLAFPKPDVAVACWEA
jgi:hypothetical protein